MEKISGVSISLVVLLLIAGFSMAGTAAPSLSNSGGGSWKFYRDITITEKSGSSLTDYQVLVQLSDSYLPVTRSDGADIRFTDTNDRELPYWIEDHTGGSAKIWVMVPNILANGEAKIRMYYGNPKAGSSSNGKQTFLAFESGLGGGLLKFQSIDKFIEESSITATNLASEGPESTYDDFGGIWDWDYVKSRDLLRLPVDSGLYTTSYIWPLNTPIRIKAIASPPNFNLYVNGELKIQNTSMPTRIFNTVAFGFGWYTDRDSGIYNFIFTRKYSFLEPAIALGAEQIIPTPTPTLTPTPTPTSTSTPTPQSQLTVKLTSDPAYAQPGQISTIKITVTKDGAPVSGVTVMLSSTPNVKFSNSSGTTTINGEFISNFTASTEGDIKISALAKKEGITDGKGDIVVQVGKITPTPTIPLKQAAITGKVIDAGTDDPVQDVTISVDGKSAVTGSNGEYELSIDIGKHNLSASKSGYKSMTRSVIVPDGGTVFDLSLKPASSDWSWILLILILVLFMAGIIYIFYRKKKLKSGPTIGGIKGERSEVETKKFCIFCKAPLPADSKFCKECGKKQEEKTRFCMHCGAPMPHAPDSCPKCGKLPPSDKDVKSCKNCEEVIPVVAKFCSACGAGQPG